MSLTRITTAGWAVFWTAILSLSAFAVPTAFAQDTSSRAIEEIIVTSRRVEESQQDIPIAVTAFTAQAIERLAPRTLRDFDGLMPNVRIGMNTAGPSAAAIYIRGVGYADIEKTQSPAVAMIVDGVQQGSNTGQLIDAFDIAQLEVNRGPQGVLQGKNTTGGSIVVTRVRPQFNEWGWVASVQGGDYSEQQAKGRLNIPLIDDTLALKISAVTKERDGFYDNTTQGCSECAGDIDYDAASVALLWEPSDTFSALFTYDYIKDRGDIPPQDPRWDGFDPFENGANLDEQQKYDVDNFSLLIEWELPFGVITSITANQDADDSVWQDFDGSNRFNDASPLVQLHTLREQEYEVFSQELKLTGDLPFVENVTYTVGGMYWDSSLDFAQGTNLILQFDPATWGLIIPDDPDLVGAGCDFFGVLTVNPNPSIGDSLCQLGPTWADQQSGEDVESYAVFAALNWNITDDIELSAGVRYIDEEKDAHTQFGERVAPGGPQDALGADINPPVNPGNTPQCIEIAPGVNINPPCTFAGFPTSGNDSWDDVIFKVSGSWHINDNSLVYLSYAEGYRSGGFSIRGTDPSRLTFEPEDSNAWEIGSKNDLWDGRVRLNATAYYQEVNDPQGSSILQQNAPPGTNTLILNGDTLESYGIEFEATWAVTDTFTLQGIYGWQDVKNKESTQNCLDVVFNLNGFPCNPVDNPGLDFGDPASLPTVTFEESDGFLATEWNYAISAIYDRDIGPGRFTANLTAKVTDDVQIASLVGVPIIQNGYTLWDARVAYAWSLDNGDVLTFEIIGKNLDDEEYREQELPLGTNGGFRGWGAPRQIAAALTWTH